MRIHIDENGNRKEITEQEYQLLVIAAEAWSKDNHLAEINALHEAEFERRWIAAGYKTEQELSRALRPTNKFYEEAKAIDDYWWDGWDAIETYGLTVTEQTAQDPQTFVNGL